jgi:hypothetical protein
MGIPIGWNQSPFRLMGAMPYQEVEIQPCSYGMWQVDEIYAVSMAILLLWNRLPFRQMGTTLYLEVGIKV